MAAFFIVPDAIMRGLFMHGKFTAADATAAAQTLMAYAVGLLPFVLIRSVVATFYARGDTATPVKAALVAVAVNIGFKILLMGPLAQIGLALATAIGAWINFTLVVWFASRAGYGGVDARLRQSVIRLVIAGVALAAALWFARDPVIKIASHWQTLKEEIALIIFIVVGAVVYGAAIAVMFGTRWFKAFRAPS